MSAIPIHGPEERWRQTVDQRGRPLKLKVGRLLKEFGYARLEPGVGEAIDSRLAQVGLRLRPPLRDATADQVVLLELVDAAGYAPATPEIPAQPLPAPPSRTPSERPSERAPAAASAPSPPPARRAVAAGDELEQSPLVRAAVEAERRVRASYDRAAAAAAERIGALERELAAERDATARARDERDELERRMHVERREAAARLHALSAAERTARGLLEAQRTELSNLTQTVRVATAAIAQTRETLGNVHEQVRRTATDVREALVDSALPDDDEAPPPHVQRVEPAATTESGDPAPADHDEPAPDANAAEDELAATGETAPFDVPHDPEPEPQPALDEPRGQFDDDGPLARRHDRAREDGQEQQEPEPGRGRARKGRGRAERLRRRAAIVCEVCGRPGKTRDPSELVDAGWRVEGQVALCLTCVADDWKLAEGDTVPFRAHG